MLSLVPRLNSRYSGLLDANFDAHFDVPNLFDSLGAKNTSIPVDVQEKDGKYIIVADMPGLNSDNISVEYKNSYLLISCNKTVEKESNSSNYHIKERGCTSKSRSIKLSKIDADSIEANLKNGVLTITANKIDKSKKIDVKID